MTEPRWVAKGREFIGVLEVKGPKHNQKILDFWKSAKLGGIKNDEVPWCAGYVGGVLEMCGIRSTRADSARSYLNWGIKLAGPLVGAIVVFERGASSGHVGFVIGRTSTGDLIVLGGNQADQVSLARFDVKRVLGYRWPEEEPVPAASLAALPLLRADGMPFSTSEA